MLASPGFTPGSGEGMAFSSTVSPSATAAIFAMWWSSAVVSSLIVEAVIFLLASGQFHAHLVWQTDGDLAGLLQPALAHAILPGAGIGADARAALVDGDDAHAQRPRHFDLLVARQRDFLEYLAAAANEGGVGDPAGPDGDRYPDREQHAGQQGEIVAGLDVAKRGHGQDCCVSSR